MISTKGKIVCWLAFFGAVILFFWEPEGAKTDWTEFALIFFTFSAAVLVTFYPYFLARNLKISESLLEELKNKNEADRIQYLMGKDISRKDAEAMVDLISEGKKHNKKIKRTENASS